FLRESYGSRRALGNSAPTPSAPTPSFKAGLASIRENVIARQERARPGSWALTTASAESSRLHEQPRPHVPLTVQRRQKRWQGRYAPRPRARPGGLERRYQTGKELWMKESHRKDLASHPDPESCGGGRKATGEALTGAHAGQPSSCEIIQPGVPTLLV